MIMLDVELKRMNNQFSLSYHNIILEVLKFYKLISNYIITFHAQDVQLSFNGKLEQTGGRHEP